MQQGNLGRLRLYLLVLVWAHRRCRTLVRCRCTLDVAVLPRTIGEIEVEVKYALRLLVAVERIEISWILVFGVSRVLVLHHHHYAQACLLASLYSRSVLGSVLGSLARHNVVSLVLLNHSVGVRHRCKIVVECLAELVVSTPRC